MKILTIISGLILFVGCKEVGWEEKEFNRLEKMKNDCKRIFKEVGLTYRYIYKDHCISNVYADMEKARFYRLNINTNDIEGIIEYLDYKERIKDINYKDLKEIR